MEEILKNFIILVVMISNCDLSYHLHRQHFTFFLLDIKTRTRDRAWDWGLQDLVEMIPKFLYLFWHSQSKHKTLIDIERDFCIVLGGTELDGNKSTYVIYFSSWIIIWRGEEGGRGPTMGQYPNIWRIKGIFWKILFCLILFLFEVLFELKRTWAWGEILYFLIPRRNKLTAK